MQVQVINPYKATVHILEYVPRKVGVKIRDFVAENDRKRKELGLEKVDIAQFKGLTDKEREEKIKDTPMEDVIFFDELNMVVCQNLIQKVEVMGGEDEQIEPLTLKDFLEAITDEDYKKISEFTSELYERTMKDIEKKTAKKPN